MIGGSAQCCCPAVFEIFVRVVSYPMAGGDTQKPCRHFFMTETERKIINHCRSTPRNEVYWKEVIRLLKWKEKDGGRIQDLRRYSLPANSILSKMAKKGILYWVADSPYNGMYRLSPKY